MVTDSDIQVEPTQTYDISIKPTQFNDTTPRFDF